MGFDGTLGGTEEGLDAEMLLDPLEEKLDLPTTPVEFGDGEGRRGEVVGQEVESSSRCDIVISDPAQGLRISLSTSTVGPGFCCNPR